MKAGALVLPRRCHREAPTGTATCAALSPGRAMPPPDLEPVRKASAAYAKADAFKPSYGTGGFRSEASQLDSTLFRCGVVAAVRCLATGGTTGLMVTASHNPAPDNGVKLVEPSGAMLPMDMEPWATRLACADGDDALVDEVAAMCSALGVSAAPGRVIIGHDTRDSSERLTRAAAAGVAAMGLHADVRGLCTTPQLHFYTAAANAGESEAEEHYVSTLVGGFTDAVAGTEPPGGVAELVVDAANGVGGAKLRAMADVLALAGLAIEVRNDGAPPGVLNHLVGADFVQKERALPQGFSAATDAGKRCATIDGDADRCVFFVPAAPGGPTAMQLFDGDRIAALAAGYVASLTALEPTTLGGLTMGVVQTAYANGASTAYLRAQGVEVVVTPTGVKHLHAAAHKYDVGVYFEANGHGTVLFSGRAKEAIRGAEAQGSVAGRKLGAFLRMVNQTVGDAVSVILLCEAVLRCKGWTMADWAAMYADLPSRQLKVKVQDRTVVTTANAETTCVTPAGVQQEIDAAVAAVPSGRAFVRPSGTEDVVRVYAEAKTQEAADALADAVAEIVRRLVGGV